MPLHVLTLVSLAAARHDESTTNLMGTHTTPSASFVSALLQTVKPYSLQDNPLISILWAGGLGDNFLLGEASFGNYVPLGTTHLYGLW